MRHATIRFLCASVLVGASIAFVSACAQAVEDEIHKIKLPPGFAIHVYARAPGARSIAVAESLETVFVGTRGGRGQEGQGQEEGSHPLPIDRGPFSSAISCMSRNTPVSPAW